MTIKDLLKTLKFGSKFFKDLWCSPEHDGKDHSISPKYTASQESVMNCDCERVKVQNTVGKQITTLAGIRRKLLIGKAD